MEQNWVDKMMEDGRCNIFDTECTTHTLVLPTSHLQSAQAAVLASRSLAELLVRWRNGVFGAAGMLDALEKADSIVFRLEDKGPFALLGLPRTPSPALRSTMLIWRRRARCV